MSDAADRAQQTPDPIGAIIGDCAWCGAEIESRPKPPPRSRRDEIFCSVTHRDQSARAVKRLHDRDADEPVSVTYLKCPECDAPCFPSESGLWLPGVIKSCTGCGDELMAGISSTGFAEAQSLDGPSGLRRRVAYAWRVSATVSVRAEDVDASVEPFEGSESRGFVASAKLCGIKLSAAAEGRGVAMTRLVEAVRVRGQMENER